MTGREWQPGDVALAKYGDEEPTIYLRAKEFSSTGPQRHRWVSSIGTHSYDFALAEWHRPLVVIDPEDREQVKRFCEIASRWADQVPYADMREPGDMDHTDAMQAALREFASPTPAKPDEPTGLGAVVEDIDGELWIRRGAPDLAPWINSKGNSFAVQWGLIASPKVLDDGYKPGESA